jgi:enoyl-[acyl-carrier-protein] reductase (NADH)
MPLFKEALEVLTRYMAKEFGDMRIRSTLYHQAQFAPSWGAA